MPHMNEVFELLKRANPYLVNLENILYSEFSQEDKELSKLGEEIEQILHEWEILKTGNLART